MHNSLMVCSCVCQTLSLNDLFIRITIATMWQITAATWDRRLCASSAPSHSVHAQVGQLPRELRSTKDVSTLALWKPIQLSQRCIPCHRWLTYISNIAAVLRSGTNRCRVIPVSLQDYLPPLRIMLIHRGVGRFMPIPAHHVFCGQLVQTRRWQ